jgi:hypothetical protein
MLTQEEKDELIGLAVEKCLLVLPEVIGNLMANHAMLHKINRKFYTDHPEFASRKDVVQAVVENMEGKFPLLPYEELLQKATPEITRRMDIVKTLSVDTVQDELPRDFSSMTLPGNGNL